jgi:hypothetical protein
MYFEDCEKIQEDFFQATAKGNLERCQALHSEYSLALCDMNMIRHSVSPLCCAAQKGQLPVIKWLISEGAAINQPDGWGLYIFASHFYSPNLLQKSGSTGILSVIAIAAS